MTIEDWNGIPVKGRELILWLKPLDGTVSISCQWFGDAWSLIHRAVLDLQLELRGGRWWATITTEKAVTRCILATAMFSSPASIRMDSDGKPYGMRITTGVINVTVTGQLSELPVEEGQSVE